MILAQRQFEGLINRGNQLTDLEGVTSVWFDLFDNTLVNVVYVFKGISFDILLRAINSHELKVVECVVAK